MAIYATPIGLEAHPFADEAGVDMTIVGGPSRDSNPGDIGFIFFAMQVGWRRPDGQSAGGGHFGLLWQDYPEPTTTRYGRINYGVYDDYIGNYSVFRGSVPTETRFVDVGNINSYGFDWEYGETYRFRVFISPNQSWLAAQLDDGDQQVPPYIGTNQQPDEVAYRLTIQNLTRHEPPVTYRDILIRGPHAGPAISGPNFWIEPMLETAFAYGADVQFANIVWDGARVVPRMAVSYNAVSPTTNCFLDGHAIRQQTLATRTNPDGTLITLPSDHWPTPPANVAPTPVAETPQATPRPWY